MQSARVWNRFDEWCLYCSLLQENTHTHTHTHEKTSLSMLVLRLGPERWDSLLHCWDETTQKTHPSSHLLFICPLTVCVYQPPIHLSSIHNIIHPSTRPSSIHLSAPESTYHPSLLLLSACCSATSAEIDNRLILHLVNYSSPVWRTNTLSLFRLKIFRF